MQDKIDFIYEVLNCVFANLGQLAEAACLSLLCRDHMRRKRRAWLVGGAYFAAILSFYYMPFVIGGFLAYLFAGAAGFLVFRLLERKNAGTGLLLSCVFFVMSTCVSNIAINISGYLIKLVHRLFDQFVREDNPVYWYYHNYEFIGLMFLDFVVSGVAMYLLVRLFNRLFRCKEGDLGLRELIFLLLPAVNGMIIFRIFAIYVPVYEEVNQISYAHVSVESDLLWGFCYGVVLATMLSSVVLYQGIREKRQQENARALLERRVRDMQLHISQVERLYSDIRGVKHDIKNHVEIINSLLAQGKIKEALDYSDALSRRAEAFDFPVKTGNPVTDVIISEKMHTAKEKGIHFVSDFRYPEGTGMDAFDISVILSNALSNAVEAAGEGGDISVTSFRNHNAYLLTVENSFDGRLEMDADSGLPRTAKQDKDSHGFGLQNIKLAAAKYFGEVQMEQNGNRVVLSVMLQGGK